MATSSALGGNVKRAWGNSMTFDADKGFGTAKRHEYTVLHWGKPRKGDYFVSGAIPQAYKAVNDMDTHYWIVLKGAEMKLTQTWVRK